MGWELGGVVAQKHYYPGDLLVLGAFGLIFGCRGGGEDQVRQRLDRGQRCIHFLPPFLSSLYIGCMPQTSVTDRHVFIQRVGA
jgi:hypothetical protein